MMTQEARTMLDKDGELVQFTCCPRCSYANKLVAPRHPDIRVVNGVVYDLYRTVCLQCSLFFKDALIHRGAEE